MSLTEGATDDDAVATSAWFVPLVEDPDRAVRVFGMPHAGAGCSALGDCAQRVDPSIALWGLNLPGRQARFAEPAVTDLGMVTSAVVEEIDRRNDRPYVLFGYCSGALLAYQSAVELRTAGLPPPVALVIAAYPAPHLALPDRELHEMPPGAFWARITAQGGFPRALAAQPDYREIFEPALRADYAMLTGFTMPDDPVLDVPLVVLAGRRDPLIDRSALLGWAGLTTANFRLELLDADHWVLQGAASDVARALTDASRLRPC